MSYDRPDRARHCAPPRPGPATFGARRAMMIRATKCLRCNGRGAYRAASGAVIDPCAVCDGTGREPSR